MWIRRKRFSQGFECTKSVGSFSFASFRLLASVCWRQFFRVKWNAEKPVQVAPSLSVQRWMGWTVGCEASPSLYKVCEVLLIWKRKFLIRFVQHHSRWNVKLSWDFFLGCRGLGVFFKCFGYWFQQRFADKRRFSTSSKSMHWFLGVLCRMLSEDKAKHMIVSEMASSSYTNSANSFITEPFAGHTHVVLGKRQLPKPVSCNYVAFPQHASPDQDS